MVMSMSESVHNAANYLKNFDIYEQGMMNVTTSPEFVAWKYMDFLRTTHNDGLFSECVINSLRPSDIYIYIYISLIQIMFCHLKGAKPLSEPTSTGILLTETFVKSLVKFFHSRKCILICRLQNGSNFVLALLC